MIVPLGKITVTTPGTTIAVDSLLPAAPLKAPSASIHAILFQAVTGNVGKIYVGRQDLDKTTLDGVMAVIPAPALNASNIPIMLPTFSIALTISPNGLSTQEFWIDADNGGESVLVTVLQA